MKSKKLLSLALASAMALTMAVPAFAAGNTETDITGTYTPPVISVVVPQTAAAFINPLGLSVEVASGVSLENRQIISAPMAIKNQGASDLQVGATVSATVNEGSDIRFVATSTGGAAAATKTVFAYLQAKQDKTLKGAETVVTDAKIAEAYGKWEAVAYNKDTDIVVNTAMPASKDNLVILRAATLSGGNFASYNAGSVALVRLAGDCTSSVTAGDGWVKTETKTEDGKQVTTGDGFTVNVAYTFKPASIAKYAVNVGEVTYGGSFDGAGGVVATVVPDVTKPAEGDTVTLTVTGANGMRVTVGAKQGTTAVALTGGTASGDNVYFDALTASGLSTTITFVMPAGDVDITVSAGDVVVAP